MIKEAAYWISFAHMSGWRHSRLNEIIIKFHHDKEISIEDFFQLTEAEWISDYDLKGKEIIDLRAAREEVANNSFLAETLDNEGYEILPIISPEYSVVLKENLKKEYAPALLYIKGNKQILKEKSIAIVGSRNSNEISLLFADNIARLASREYKVVVSGFAKGVDKQALDSALKYKGQSIIVLPQGILTFGTGYKTYYRQIVDGDLLVVSTFFPKAPWRTELAMARNVIIYGLASEIYVAESSETGGTWAGVTDGLRKKRTIYIRFPDLNEKNANRVLIQKGAIPVDMEGNRIIADYPRDSEMRLPGVAEEAEETLEQKVRTLLEKKPMSIRDLMAQTGTELTQKKFSTMLEKHDFIEVARKGNTRLYKLKGTGEPKIANQSALEF